MYLTDKGERTWQYFQKNLYGALRLQPYQIEAVPSRMEKARSIWDVSPHRAAYQG